MRRKSNQEEIIKYFKALLKEVWKLKISTYTYRINFSIMQPHEVIEEKYVDPVIDGVNTYSKLFKDIKDKYWSTNKYAEQNILRYCQNILKIVAEKSANCKSALQEGLFNKAEDEYDSIYTTLFVELEELMYKWIGYYDYQSAQEAFKKYSFITDEVIADEQEEWEDFDISKSFENIINNIDYIKDILLQMFAEED